MSAIFESRLSDSPHVEIIWRGRVEQTYQPLCPADVRWNLLFVKYQDQVRVSVEGATTKSILKNSYAGSEFLVIKFKLGAYMPFLPASTLVDCDAVLPEGASHSFGMHGATWELPNFENVEAFVERMVREGLLIHDPVVGAVLQDQVRDVSERTVRRRFLYATGLTQGVIRQIERAQQAAALLQQHGSILDAVYEAGYADQPHLTRSLKRFFGQTPAQMVGQSE